MASSNTRLQEIHKFVVNFTTPLREFFGDRPYDSKDDREPNLSSPELLALIEELPATFIEPGVPDEKYADMFKNLMRANLHDAVEKSMNLIAGSSLVFNVFGMFNQGLNDGLGKKGWFITESMLVLVLENISGPSWLSVSEATKKSAMSQAIRKNKLRVVKLLLQLDPTLSLKGSQRDCFYVRAARSGRFEILQALYNEFLKQAKEEDFSKFQKSPLLVVTLLGMSKKSSRDRASFVKIFEWLLELGGSKLDLSISNDRGILPIEFAIIKGFSDQVEMLFAKGVRFDPYRLHRENGWGASTSEGYALLDNIMSQSEYLSVDIGKLGDLSSAVVLQRSNLVAMAALGSQLEKDEALQVAVIKNNFTAVQELIESGANPGFQEMGRFTALHLAVFLNRQYMVELFRPCFQKIEKQYHIENVIIEGETETYNRLSYHQGLGSPLQWAIRLGHKPIVQEYIDEMIALGKDAYFSPLLDAITYAEGTMLKFLLSIMSKAEKEEQFYHKVTYRYGSNLDTWLIFAAINQKSQGAALVKVDGLVKAGFDFKEFLRKKSSHDGGFNGSLIKVALDAGHMKLASYIVKQQAKPKAFFNEEDRGAILKLCQSGVESAKHVKESFSSLVVESSQVGRFFRMFDAETLRYMFDNGIRVELNIACYDAFKPGGMNYDEAKYDVLTRLEKRSLNPIFIDLSSYSDPVWYKKFWNSHRELASSIIRIFVLTPNKIATCIGASPKKLIKPTGNFAKIMFRLINAYRIQAEGSKAELLTEEEFEKSLKTTGDLIPYFQSISLAKPLMPDTAGDATVLYDIVVPFPVPASGAASGHSGEQQPGVAESKIDD